MGEGLVFSVFKTAYNWSLIVVEKRIKGNYRFF